MLSTATDPQQHVHRVLDVVRHGPRNLTSELVADSWSRCLNVHRLDPSQPRRPPVLSRQALSERCDRQLDVIECARYEMSTLYQQLGDPHAAIVLTDTDGVILHMTSSPEFEREVAPFGLEVGAVWSEAEAGTNGMGTCVAAARPVAVVQEDHFFTHYTSLTCSAVPIHDPAGEICAVLDVSSRSQQPQQHLLVLLGMTARMIENRLIDMRFRDAHPVHFHSRPEFVYTLHEGKLVVDPGGSVLAANRSALLQLGLDSVRQIRGKRLDQIFQTTLDDMLQRSHRAAFHPVVTYRVNAANRFFAVARQPTRAVAAAHAAVSGAGALASSAPSTRTHERAPTFADPVLQARFATAQRVVARGTPLLLRGETGAGKEVFARGVHASSPRAGGPFVAINCASLPETLIEAELFGYRAGAFTGAERRGRQGKIAQADGGTLFLDEIGDMPMEAQTRLLRVLQEGEFTTVGGRTPIRTDVRIVAATNKNLEQQISQGLFREDLFFRLNVVPLRLPPLRERTEDIPDLVQHFMTLGEKLGLPRKSIQADALDRLKRHSWPGNIRELENLVRRLCALYAQDTITRDIIDNELASSQPSTHDMRDAGPVSLGEWIENYLSDYFAKYGDDLPPAGLYDRILSEIEPPLITAALAATRGNQIRAAELLGLNRNTLRKKLREHKIRVVRTPN